MSNNVFKILKHISLFFVYLGLTVSLSWAIFKLFSLDNGIGWLMAGLWIIAVGTAALVLFEISYIIFLIIKFGSINSKQMIYDKTIDVINQELVKINDHIKKEENFRKDWWDSKH